MVSEDKHDENPSNESEFHFNFSHLVTDETSKINKENPEPIQSQSSKVDEKKGLEQIIEKSPAEQIESSSEIIEESTYTKTTIQDNSVTIENSHKSSKSYFNFRGIKNFVNNYKKLIAAAAIIVAAGIGVGVLQKDSSHKPVSPRKYETNQIVSSNDLHKFLILDNKDTLSSNKQDTSKIFDFTSYLKLPKEEVKPTQTNTPNIGIAYPKDNTTPTDVTTNKTAKFNDDFKLPNDSTDISKLITTTEDSTYTKKTITIFEKHTTIKKDTIKLNEVVSNIVKETYNLTRNKLAKKINKIAKFNFDYNHKQQPNALVDNKSVIHTADGYKALNKKDGIMFDVVRAGTVIMLPIETVDTINVTYYTDKKNKTYIKEGAGFKEVSVEELDSMINGTSAKDLTKEYTPNTSKTDSTSLVKGNSVINHDSNHKKVSANYKPRNKQTSRTVNTKQATKHTGSINPSASRDAVANSILLEKISQYQKQLDSIEPVLEQKEYNVNNFDRVLVQKTYKNTSSGVTDTFLLPPIMNEDSLRLVVKKEYNEVNDKYNEINKQKIEAISRLKYQHTEEIKDKPKNLEIKLDQDTLNNRKSKNLEISDTLSRNHTPNDSIVSDSLKNKMEGYYQNYGKSHNNSIVENINVDLWTSTFENGYRYKDLQNNSKKEELLGILLDKYMTSTVHQTVSELGITKYGLYKALGGFRKSSVAKHARQNLYQIVLAA